MSISYLSFPFTKLLSRAESWSTPDEPRETYSAIRFHCVLDEHPVWKSKTKMGGRINLHYTEGAKTVTNRTIEREVSVVDVVESVKESLFTNEFLDDVSASLGSPLPSLPLVPGVKAKLTRRLTKQTNTLHRLQQTVTRKEKITLSVSHESHHADKSKYLNVETYEKRVVDVYVLWIDYLTIEYQRTAFGLRKKRIKTPAFAEGNRIRQNEIIVKHPVGSFQYWKLLEDSVMVVSEDNYKNQVKDPTEVKRVSTPKKGPTMDRKRYPRVPSLYQLSNAAFCLRWIDQHRSEMSDEELLALEHEEVKDSVWWFQNGPGITERRARARKRRRNGQG